MSDEDVATRAPESDAAEQSIIPGDTKVDQGAASLGEHCTTDRPTPSGQKPTGEISTFADTEVYISKPSDYPHAPSKLLLLLTGGTGVHSTNNQLQADRFAAEGYLVVMPDQFAGDPAPSASNTTTNTTNNEATPSYIEQVKLNIASVAKSFTIDMWLARQTPERVLPALRRVLTSIREEFADAVANGGGIYAVGYCFGARYALLLGAELPADVAAGQRASDNATSQAEEGMVTRGPEVKCAAVAHGTQITPEEIAAVAVPVSIAAVEGDSLFPDEVREGGVKALKEKGVEVEEVVYKNVPHGFAVLGDYAEEHIKKEQEKAYEQMLAWLKAH